MQKRKCLEGVVASNKMNKTVVVTVFGVIRHPKYGKVVRVKKKCYAHVDGDVILNVGDKVSIVETRPLSKLKRWRVVSNNYVG